MSMLGAECLSNFLENLLGQYFDKLHGKIQLCIGCREQDHSVQDKNPVWSFLCGKPESIKRIHNIAEKVNATEDFYGKCLETAGESILCVRECTEVNDSRLESNGIKKELLWIFLSKEKGTACRILCDIVLDEIVSKFTDLIRLEAMGFLQEVDETSIQDAENSGVAKYFFGNLLNREWLVNRYMKKCLTMFGLPEWQILVQLSSMFYEKRTIKTRIYFTDKEKSGWKKEGLLFKVEENLVSPVKVTSANLRIIRKMMELSGRRHGLLAVGKDHQIVGLIRDNSQKSPETYVEFSDHLVWKVVNDSEEIFEYRKGEHRLCSLESRDDTEEELNKLSQLPLNEDQIQEMKSTLRTIMEKSEHGTSIVFINRDEAEAEVKRLASHNRGYGMEPFKILKNKKELSGLISVDGAIIADLDCNCLGAGMILDGKSLVPGNVGRGARYNSLVNYVNLIKKEEPNICCFAAIISEDGSLDIEIPKAEK